MNVQTSTLNGFNNLYIAPDSQPTAFSTTASMPGSYLVHNDSQSENGPYTPQIAMAVSINTAYADLWHRVGGSRRCYHGAAIRGVNTNARCITASCSGNFKMENEAGVALGQASLTVVEQATMLATIDKRRRLPQRPRHRVHRPEQRPVRADQGHQLPGVQLRSHGETRTRPRRCSTRWSRNDAPYGTAPGAGMSNCQEDHRQTGTILRSRRTPITARIERRFKDPRTARSPGSEARGSLSSSRASTSRSRWASSPPPANRRRPWRSSGPLRGYAPRRLGSEARLADQERDGVAAEVLYPTVGMMICNHPDVDFKQACFDAYNLWIAEYCAAHPDRLIGAGQTAVRSVADGIRDLERIKALGLRGVMMPGNPGVADYDDPMYDPLWEAAVDLGLP